MKRGATIRGVSIVQFRLELMPHQWSSTRITGVVPKVPSDRLLDCTGFSYSGYGTRYRGPNEPVR